VRSGVLLVGNSIDVLGKDDARPSVLVRDAMIDEARSETVEGSTPLLDKELRSIVLDPAVGKETWVLVRLDSISERLLNEDKISVLATPDVRTEVSGNVVGKAPEVIDRPVLGPTVEVTDSCELVRLDNKSDKLLSEDSIAVLEARSRLVIVELEVRVNEAGNVVCESPEVLDKSMLDPKVGVTDSCVLVGLGRMFDMLLSEDKISELETTLLLLPIMLVGRVKVADVLGSPEVAEFRSLEIADTSEDSVDRSTEMEDCATLLELNCDVILEGNVAESTSEEVSIDDVKLTPEGSVTESMSEFEELMALDVKDGRPEGVDNIPEVLSDEESPKLPEVMEGKILIEVVGLIPEELAVDKPIDVNVGKFDKEEVVKISDESPEVLDPRSMLEMIEPNEVKELSPLSMLDANVGTVNEGVCVNVGTINEELCENVGTVNDELCVKVGTLNNDELSEVKVGMLNDGRLSEVNVEALKADESVLPMSKVEVTNPLVLSEEVKIGKELDSVDD